MRKERKQDFILDEATRTQASKQIKSGKALFGREGAFGPLQQQLLEAALEGFKNVPLCCAPGERNTGELTQFSLR